MPFAGLRAGSRTFGVIAIVLGGISGCTVLAIPLAWVMPQSNSQPRPRTGQMIGGGLMMVAYAVALIWFGIGACRLRRWVRPLGIAGSAIWALLGIMSLIATAFTIPELRASMHPGPAAASLPPGFDLVMVGFTIALLVAFGIAVPGACLWFYKKPQTGLMLDYYDPQPRWTDGCPLPILGLTMALTLLAVTSFVTAPAAIDAIFGVVLFGLPAAALLLFEGAVMSVLARLVFLRRPAGWWGSVGLAVIWTASSAMALLHPRQVEMGRRAGFSDQEIAAWNGGGTVAAQLTAGIPTMLFAFGYLLYVRRFFAPTVKPISTSAE
jgi:hypothetical protein